MLSDDGRVRTIDWTFSYRFSYMICCLATYWDVSTLNIALHGQAARGRKHTNGHQRRKKMVVAGRCSAKNGSMCLDEQQK